MTRAPRAVHLDELEATPGPGTLTWRPVRAHLGLRAFGTNAYSAAKVGDADPARAREIVDDGLHHHPDSPALLILLARLDVRAGREDEARAALRRALERQPEADELAREDPALAPLLDGR